MFWLVIQCQARSRTPSHPVIPAVGSASARRRLCSRRRLCRLRRGRGRGRGHSSSCRRQVCVLFLNAIRVSYILQLGSERVGL